MVFFLSLSSIPLVHIPCLVLRFCLQSQATVVHVAVVSLRVSCHFQCSLLTSLMTEMKSVSCLVRCQSSSLLTLFILNFVLDSSDLLLLVGGHGVVLLGVFITLFFLVTLGKGSLLALSLAFSGSLALGRSLSLLDTSSARLLGSGGSGGRGSSRRRGSKFLQLVLDATEGGLFSEFGSYSCRRSRQ
jgi:hypothetical protein